MKGIIVVNIFAIFVKQGAAGPRCAECQGLFSYRCPSGLNSKITHLPHTHTHHIAILFILGSARIVLLLICSIFSCIVGGSAGITNQPRQRPWINLFTNLFGNLLTSLSKSGQLTTMTFYCWKNFSCVKTKALTTWLPDWSLTFVLFHDTKWWPPAANYSFPPMGYIPWSPLGRHV